MAVSDPLGITAQGLQTLRRKNKRLDYEALAQVIGQYNIAEIVVGYPLRMSGATGTHAFGPSPWTAAATTGAKPPIANPICVPTVMRDAAHGC